MAISPLESTEYRNGLIHKRFRLGDPVGLIKQLRWIVEIDRYCGVVIAERGPIYSKRFPHQCVSLWLTLDVRPPARLKGC